MDEQALWVRRQTQSHDRHSLLLGPRIMSIHSDLRFPDCPQATIWNTAICYGTSATSSHSGSSGSQLPRKRRGDPLRQQGAAIYLKTLSAERRASTMRVPIMRQSCHDGRWETIRYALDSNPRTFRLCLIMLVLITASALAAAVALHCGSATVHGVTRMSSWFPPSFR
jgi:hypothetical protein